MSTTTTFQNASYFSGAATASTLTQAGGINYSDFYNTEGLENKYEYNNTKESYETKDTAQDEAIATGVTNLLYQLETGYEDKAMESYNNLISLLKEQTQYSTLSDSELQAVAKSLLNSQLQENTDGKYTNIQDYIVDYAADADENYMQKVLWKNSKVDSTTEGDLLKTICGIDTDETVSAWTKIKGFVANIFTLGCGSELLDFAKHH
ncbi:MAG: hypothetical protein LUG16_08805 [Candidatus Gastranaerophilales bacterium]|nr:hypothetical protein [Candidatus Gastranaerophilales bacterium]